MPFDWNFCTAGIPDENFAKDNSPMTKEEIRVLVLSKLRLKEDSIILDIGAGTGSISIEAAMLSRKGFVYSVEMDKERINTIEKNIHNFGIKNIITIEGLAPVDLSNVPHVDRVIIGGSSGNLKGIFDWININLKPEGRLVILSITLETLCQSFELIQNNNYKEIEVCHVSISKGKRIGKITMMEGRNPIYILSATRK